MQRFELCDRFVQSALERRTISEEAFRGQTESRHATFEFELLHDRGGEIDRAAEWLERSYEMRDHELVYLGGQAFHSDALRADPRFSDLLRRLKLPVPEVVN